MTREDKIETVLKGIMNTEPVELPHFHTEDYIQCPLCGEYKIADLNEAHTLEGIDHMKDCIYLVAKDLMTNK